MALMESHRDLILDKLKEMPALPGAGPQIVTMMQDPDVEISDLVKVIEYDPGLTTNVLRWANSAYFGFAQEITSVRQALVLLGLNQMSRLLMASLVGPLLGRRVKGYDMEPGQLLRHSVAVAIGTEETARHCGIKPPGHAFTSGLLHDIGKLVLGVMIERFYPEIQHQIDNSGLNFHEAERQVLGIDHAEVGALLLKRWNIPDKITNVVRWHHEPERAPEKDDALALVHVAQMLSVGAGIGSGRDGTHYTIDAGVLAKLHLSPEQLEDTAAKIVQRVGAFADPSETAASRVEQRRRA